MLSTTTKICRKKIIIVPFRLQHLIRVCEVRKKKCEKTEGKDRGRGRNKKKEKNESQK